MSPIKIYQMLKILFPYGIIDDRSYMDNEIIQYALTEKYVVRYCIATNEIALLKNLTDDAVSSHVLDENENVLDIVMKYAKDIDCKSVFCG